MKNILFDECVVALKAKVLSKEESEKIEKRFITLFPTTGWGKINWNKINEKNEIDGDPENIIVYLENILGTSFDRSVYIEWSDGELPIIQTNLDSIIECFDDVACVSFEKFIFNPMVGYIIEVLSNGKITVGIIEQVYA